MDKKKWLYVIAILMLISVSVKIVMEQTPLGKEIRDSRIQKEIIESPFESFIDKYEEIDNFCMGTIGRPSCRTDIGREIFIKYSMDDRLKFCEEISSFGKDQFCITDAVVVDTELSYNELFSICTEYKVEKECVLELNKKFVKEGNIDSEKIIRSTFEVCTEHYPYKDEWCFEDVMGNFMWSKEYFFYSDVLKDLCIRYPYPESCESWLLEQPSKNT